MDPSLDPSRFPSQLMDPSPDPSLWQLQWSSCGPECPSCREGIKGALATPRLTLHCDVIVCCEGASRLEEPWSCPMEGCTWTTTVKRARADHLLRIHHVLYQPTWTRWRRRWSSPLRPCLSDRPKTRPSWRFGQTEFQSFNWRSS